MNTIAPTFERTGNLLNIATLANSDIAYSNGVLTGKASKFGTNYSGGIIDVSSFATDVITVSITAKKVSGDTSTGNGISLRVVYSDETFDYLNFANTDTEYVSKMLVSKENATISKVLITYSSAGANIWNVKDLMVFVGVTDRYVPYKTAVDYVARGRFGQIDGIEQDLAKNDFDTALMMENYEWAYTAVSGTVTTGQYITSTGAISDIAGDWNVETVEVEAETQYKVTAQAYNGNYYFAYYDSNMTFISGVKATAASTSDLTNYITLPPDGAVYLVAVCIDDGHRNIEKTTSIVPIKKWNGKKWACVGDSLTNGASRTSKYYYNYVAESTGITPVNMGDSGSGYAKEQNVNTAFYQRISSVPLDSDVITIFGSFNDLSAGLNLGTKTDSGTTTIAGCINTTLDNLFTAFPLANVGVVTPTPWQAQNPTDEPNTASAYVDMIVSICKMRGIPCLDLFHCSGLRPWDSSYRQVVYSKDDGNGTHPNEIGHGIIAPRFEAFLETLLLD